MQKPILFGKLFAAVKMREGTNGHINHKTVVASIYRVVHVKNRNRPQVLIWKEMENVFDFLV